MGINSSVVIGVILSVLLVPKTNAEGITAKAEKTIYPEEAKLLGHQGTAVVKVTVLTDGTLESATIHVSSRSKILDQAALETVKSWKFGPAIDKEGRPVDSSGGVKVTFYKDDPETFHLKTCSDVNIDVKYFKNTFPELRIEKMYLNSLAMILTWPKDQNAKRVMHVARAFSPSFSKSLADCEAHPEEKFLDLLIQNIDSFLLPSQDTLVK